MKAKTVREALVATRWIIDQVGWCQGRLYQAKDGNVIWYKGGIIPGNLGACCLEGAMSLVEIDSEYVRFDAGKKIRAIGTDHTSIHIWNDALGRTKEQVLAMLDQVIVRLPK